MEYTYGLVPATAFAGMICSGIIAVILPIVLMIVWKKKTSAKVSSFFIGCGTFVVFAFILEQIFHTVVLKLTGSAITGNIWLYALYGGICAGIFEETGRFVSMKFLMKNTLDKKNGIMYGIGHGGIEAILIVGISEVSNIATGLAVNSGTISAIINAVPDETLRNQTYEQISVLWTNPGNVFFAGGVERISAIAFHICASYLVYKAVADKKILNYVLAVALHFALDAITVVINGQGCSIWILEAIVFVFSAVCCYFVVRDYRSRKDASEAEQAEDIAANSEAVAEE